MRSYENSGYNPYNDNYRSESRGSHRNYYSNDFDSSNRNRSYDSDNYRSSGLGSGRDSYANSGYGNASTYGRSAGTSNYGSGNYGSGYGSSDYSSNRRWSSDDDTDRYGRDSWDRAGDKIENTWERTKNRASNAWDRATNDNDRDNDYNRYGSNRNYSTYGSTGYGYGSSYGSTDRDRYSSDYDRNRYSTDYDRDRHDRGFFDRAGDEIKSWFGDDEAERRRRMDERRERDEYNRYGRSSSSYGNTYSGPPYSYGSSSRRDYEW
ncbi:SWFGD domain-containing protein [Pontibacter sp. MBLB2868]|uniref:SWFGD domain-containing protein n=1 Tax=Pontibacter sp. MBLB2868 TaxID=3451555 RepID=UPI003F74C34B